MVGLHQKNSMGQLQPAEKFYSHYYALKLLNCVPSSGINMLGKVLEKQRGINFQKWGFSTYVCFFTYAKSYRKYFQTTTVLHQADYFKNWLDMIKSMF